MILVFFRNKDIRQMKKAHISGYTNKNGTYVSPHEDSRVAAMKTESEYKQGDRVVSVHGDKFTIVGRDPSNADRLLAKEDGAAFASSILIRNITKRIGDKPARKASTGREETTRLYHGSHKDDLKEIHGDGVFRGLFAGEKNVAMSHGRHIYAMDVREDKILDHSSSSNLSGANLSKANKEIKSHLQGKYTKKEFDAIRDAILEDGDVEGMTDDRVSELTGWDGETHAVSWQIQMLRGQVARALGYHAVNMKDEHGVTTLVLPGTKIKRVKQ